MWVSRHGLFLARTVLKSGEEKETPCWYGSQSACMISDLEEKIFFQVIQNTIASLFNGAYVF